MVCPSRVVESPHAVCSLSTGRAVIGWRMGYGERCSDRSSEPGNLVDHWCHLSIDDHKAGTRPFDQVQQFGVTNRVAKKPRHSATSNCLPPLPSRSNTSPCSN